MTYSKGLALSVFDRVLRPPLQPEPEEMQLRNNKDGRVKKNKSGILRTRP